MTDVVLPGASGPKLADRLSGIRPQMKVLFVSGYTADALIHGDVHRSDFAFLSSLSRSMHLRERFELS